jgi:hypothetical protein
VVQEVLLIHQLGHLVQQIPVAVVAEVMEALVTIQPQDLKLLVELVAPALLS